MRTCCLSQIRSVIMALIALSVLAGCSSVSLREPAPIVEAKVLSTDGSDDVVDQPTIPVPAVLEPGPFLALRPAPPPKIFRKPVKKPPVVIATPTPPVPVPPPASPPPLVNVQDLAMGEVRGLLDAEVQRPNGKVVGRAVDAVAAADHQARALIVNLVGFMGVGDRKVSLPWPTFRFDPADRRVPISLKSDAIEATSSSPSASGSPAPAPGGINLIDAVVRTRGSHREVGRVVDILLDSSGQPRAVVMDISDSLIHDTQLVAADWSTLHVMGQGKDLQLVTDLDEKQIQASPPYVSNKPARIVSPAAAASPPAGNAVAASAPSASVASAGGGAARAASPVTAATPPVSR